MSDVVTPTTPAPTTPVTENTDSSPVESNKPVESSPQPTSKYKLKANGVEVEHTLEEVLKLASLGKGADSKFQEAAKARKQAEQFMSALKSDPISILTNPNLGIDFKKIAEEYLFNQIQAESLSPEERRQREMESELEKYRNKDKEEMTKREREQALQAEQHYAEHYDRIITDGLSKSGLPKTQHTVKMTAYYLSKALDAGLDVDVTDVLPLVKQDYMNQIAELFGSSDADTLMALLGDQGVNKIRKRDLERLRGDNQPAPKPKENTSSSSSSKDEKMNTEKFREYMRKKVGV